MNARAPALFVLIAGLTAEAAIEPSETEVRIKTEALVNLPRYVEWPASVFVVPQTPLIVGLYGHSRIHDQIVKEAQGKMVNGRPMMVRRYYWPQVPNCQMLFIAASERQRLPRIMKRLQYTSVLTVAERDDFFASGGMVRISFKDEKARFHVQMTAADEAGLKFSSTFLSVAEKVVSTP